MKSFCVTKNMSHNMENKYKDDFGHYADLWAIHKENYKKVIRVAKDYIVYIDKNNNIDWETSETYDGFKLTEGNAVYEKALSQCSIVEFKPIDGLSEVSIISFKIIVGESVVNCLEKNYIGSAELLTEAEKFRIDRVVEKSREWYLSYTVILSTILILAALAINRSNAIGSEEILQKIDIGAWAIAGACLSIILRSGRLHNASYAGKRLHFIESGCRLIGGCISGEAVNQIV
jgi:hypothetical protein